MSDTIKEDAVQNEELDLIPVEEESNDTMFDYEESASEVEESAEDAVEESQNEVEDEVENEVQGESPKRIKDVPHKEDPSRFEFWQSKFTKEQQARKELEDKFQSLAEKLESPKSPEPEPLKRPVKPNSDDPLDKIEYLEQLAEYNQTILDQTQRSFREQQESQLKAQEQAQFKAYMLGEYQKAGADEKLSAEAFNFFSSEDSLNPQTQIDLYNAWKNNRASTNPKVTQMKSQKMKQDIPLPPGVSGGESYSSKEMDFGDDLLAITKKYKV